jgi:hypothetical protein
MFDWVCFEPESKLLSFTSMVARIYVISQITQIKSRRLY